MNRGRADVGDPAEQAVQLVAEIFSSDGWTVSHPSATEDRSPELLVRRADRQGVIEVKWMTDGRGDRLLPLWSQACLEVMRHTRNADFVAAIIVAPQVSARAAQALLRFAEEHAPQVGVGVIDLAGLRRFQGHQLEVLNSDRTETAKAPAISPASADLFSDLNQWMLKVLLAKDIPEEMLSAPRDDYRNASELAAAANVSVMSAFRFIQQLQRDDHLDARSPYLRLVRREELFRRWASWAAVRPVKEIPMRWLYGGDLRKRVQAAGEQIDVCLGLFAAAHELGVGFVEGVTPYVLVRRLDAKSIAPWNGAVTTERGERPDFFLRATSTPQSVFRGRVEKHSTPICDILQVWLDVSTHPSRGEEQATLIWRRVLSRLREA